jgi:hypothetical protein
MCWLSSGKDLNKFYETVIETVAKELKLNIQEWCPHSELLEKIKSKNMVVSQKLEVFFDAYKKWHELHTKESAGSLSKQEQATLKTFLSKRNDSREELMNALRN